jgi:hypothetical protein
MGQSWENYVSSQEMPEQCPECGGENCSEAGEWLDPKHPGFCSTSCADAWAEREFQSAEYEKERQLLLEHNKGCPLCRGNSQKCCFHYRTPEEE